MRTPSDSAISLVIELQRIAIKKMIGETISKKAFEKLQDRFIRLDLFDQTYVATTVAGFRSRVKFITFMKSK